MLVRLAWDWLAWLGRRWVPGLLERACGLGWGCWRCWGLGALLGSGGAGVWSCWGWSCWGCSGWV